MLSREQYRGVVMLVRLIAATMGVILSLSALLLALLIVIPVPTYRLWRYSVGAIELSLWLGILGLLGALLSLASWGYRSPTALVLLIAGLGAFGLGLLPLNQARIVAAREGQRLSIGDYLSGFARTQSPVEITRDIVFAEVGGEPLRLDVYRPPTQDTLPAAGVIVIHGGSWRGGARGEFPAWSRALANDGYVVFDVEYRLADGGRHFPIQVGDVKCAVGWIKRNAATYGVDPAGVALLGRSAGGQLALVAAYAPTDPALPATCVAEDPSVQAVVSIYAPVDLIWGYNNPARPDLIDGQNTLRNYLGGTPVDKPEAYRLASPHTLVDQATPPTLIIHGERDRIVGVQHAGFLETALREKNVPHQVVRLPWADHGFDFFFDGWGSQIAWPIMRDFLRRHLDVAAAEAVREQDRPSEPLARAGRPR
jgi:acetyl esterase/lipase